MDRSMAVIIGTVVIIIIITRNARIELVPTLAKGRRGDGSHPVETNRTFHRPLVVINLLLCVVLAGVLCCCSVVA